MALREERNEQNSQAWRAHFERERLDLSASVEAALLDDGHILAAEWDDDLDEQDDAQPVTSGTALVPPRLSLRSKTLPAVQPERVVATTDAYRATSAQIVEAEQQPSGMLARLARRFTSSFAVVKVESPHHQVPSASFTQAFNQATMETYQPAPVGKLLSAPADPPLVRVIDTVTSPDPIVQERQTEPQKRSTLKRNGKVRLQTTQQPAITKASLQPRIEEQETGEALLADVRNALKGQPVSPVVPAPAVVPVYGSGAFESGMSDIMVANASVTASSVVLVTLTTNPGPVVMQYISLQPRVGFTIHLTAPVTMRTAFNYVLFAGETPVA